LPCADRRQRLVTGGNGADEFESRGQISEIRAAHRKPVHHRAIERRVVAIGQDFAGQPAVGRLGKRDRLGFRQGNGTAADDRAGLIDRDHLRQ